MLELLPLLQLFLIAHMYCCMVNGEIYYAHFNCSSGGLPCISYKRCSIAILEMLINIA